MFTAIHAFHAESNIPVMSRVVKFGLEKDRGAANRKKKREKRAPAEWVVLAPLRIFAKSNIRELALKFSRKFLENFFARQIF